MDETCPLCTGGRGCSIARGSPTVLYTHLTRRRRSAPGSGGGTAARRCRLRGHAVREGREAEAGPEFLHPRNTLLKKLRKNRVQGQTPARLLGELARRAESGSFAARGPGADPRFRGRRGGRREEGVLHLERLVKVALKVDVEHKGHLPGPHARRRCSHAPAPGEEGVGDGPAPAWLGGRTGAARPRTTGAPPPSPLGLTGHVSSLAPY